MNKIVIFVVIAAVVVEIYAAPADDPAAAVADAAKTAANAVPAAAAPPAPAANPATAQNNPKPKINPLGILEPFIDIGKTMITDGQKTLTALFNAFTGGLKPPTE